MEKMDSRFNKPDEPVCRFGPGGDFISVWPGESSGLSQSAPNSLTKVLSSIAEIIATMLGPEPHASSAISGYAEKDFAEEGKKKYGRKDSKAESTADTASATIIKSDSFISDEPKLFADDRRISIRDVHKQKHRIRAYRRASKKRTTFRSAGQGTLFKADFKCTRTA